MQNTEKSARLEARLDPSIHATLKRAAEIEGRSLTDFVVSAALGAARETIERLDILHLGLKSAESMAQMMLSNAPIAPAMDRAAQAHRKLIDTK